MTEAAAGLSAPVQTLFHQLHHAGALVDAGTRVVQGEAGSRAQGVQVRFYWAVEGARIRAARYQAYGCPYTLAACEWLARAMPGRPQEDPWPGDPLQWAQLLQAPPERLGRLLVIEDALQATRASWPATPG